MTLSFSFFIFIFLVLSDPQLKFAFSQVTASSPGAAVKPIERTLMVTDSAGGCHSTESIFRSQGSASSVSQSGEIPGYALILELFVSFRLEP